MRRFDLRLRTHARLLAAAASGLLVALALYGASASAAGPGQLIASGAQAVAVDASGNLYIGTDGNSGTVVERKATGPGTYAAASTIASNLV